MQLKNKQNVFDYIKSQKWFFGVRAEESLLFYSAKVNGQTKHIEKEYGTAFAETLLVPIKKGCPIRVFNLWQAKKFHVISNEKILKDPKILISYVKKDNFVYKEIEAQGKKLLKAVEKEDLRESIKLYKKIVALYEIASAHFIIIFSLGLKLAENKNVLKNINNVELAHDTWRNRVAFKEEMMGENLFYFFKFLTRKEKLSCNPLLLMKFLTLHEIDIWLDGKVTGKKIQNIINKRNKSGYVYLNIRNKKREIIDDQKEIVKIQKYFLKLNAGSERLKDNTEFSGQVAYGSQNKIIGQVIVIKDKAELRSKSHLIKDKILVAIQTRPHYIPYMSNAVAIITDEGGLTCHAVILSREFKIPCIIGTKIATQVLKNGMKVEVDAYDGVVRILKK